MVANAEVEFDAMNVDMELEVMEAVTGPLVVDSAF